MIVWCVIDVEALYRRRRVRAWPQCNAMQPMLSMLSMQCNAINAIKVMSKSLYRRRRVRACPPSSAARALASARCTPGDAIRIQHCRAKHQISRRCGPESRNADNLPTQTHVHPMHSELQTVFLTPWKKTLSPGLPLPNGH